MSLSKLSTFVFGIVSMLVISAAYADALDDAMVSYRDCTESAMPLLDDGKSDVETIAIGLHAQCRDQFEAIYQVRPTLSRKEWLKIVQPHVVQYILKYRVMQSSRKKAPPMPAM